MECRQGKKTEPIVENTIKRLDVLAVEEIDSYRL